MIGSIQYNHSPGYMYNVSKDRPFGRLMDTAREVLREALPIKCIEAVFLGTLLTAGWEGLHRMPLGFKSTANGETYRWAFYMHLEMEERESRDRGEDSLIAGVARLA